MSRITEDTSVPELSEMSHTFVSGTKFNYLNLAHIYYGNVFGITTTGLRMTCSAVLLCLTTLSAL